MTRLVSVLRTGIVAAAAVAVLGWVSVGARQRGQAVPLDADDIGGVVTGPRGPEAGVWVIAETQDLPTRFSRTVVTDDRGRYLLPDLPKATYRVWVRGYGLVDSPRVQAAPGKALDLTAVPAPSPKAAALIYPAGYWFALMRPPEVTEFPGTGGNAVPTQFKTQAEWLRVVKSGNCWSCHQLGSKGTREVPTALGSFPSSTAAWERRILSGQAGGQMSALFNLLGRPRALAMFSDWTDRIAAGAVPQAPPRPQGVERNVVITQWDWADPRAYLHDEVATDRRNPSINANGLIYGSLELSADYLPVLNPTAHQATRVKLTVRDPATPPAIGPKVAAPSPYWDTDPIWDSKNNVHNPMMDERGRVWLTSAVRPAANPAFCQEGSSHPSAKAFPLKNAGRHLAMWDPAAQKLTHIGTCFGTHHLMFAEDANHTLWTSGGGQVVGWLNRKMFDETGDEERSQGWTPMVMDTNGNGRRDAYVEPNAPVDPAKDTRINGAFYAVSPAPDGSVWGTVLGFPGGVVRMAPGTNPSETALSEYYELPYGNAKAAVQGYSPRGGDIDRNGVYWAALASGQLASFDRRVCKAPLNGPAATGQHCPEGWRFYTEPLPQFSGVKDAGSAEASYYTWVDWFDVGGFGRNTPINTGNGSEGLLVLKDGKWIVLRVPYPNGYYTKWLDGRIDDPSAGWKGRGLWSTVSTRTPFHGEGGRGATSQVVKFQMRPNPLAR